MAMVQDGCGEHRLHFKSVRSYSMRHRWATYWRPGQQSRASGGGKGSSVHAIRASLGYSFNIGQECNGREGCLPQWQHWGALKFVGVEVSSAFEQSGTADAAAAADEGAARIVAGCMVWFEVNFSGEGDAGHPSFGVRAYMLLRKPTRVTRT